MEIRFYPGSDISMNVFSMAVAHAHGCMKTKQMWIFIASGLYTAFPSTNNSILKNLPFSQIRSHTV